MLFNLSFQYSESGVERIVGQFQGCRSQIAVQNNDGCPEPVTRGQGRVEKVGRHAVVLGALVVGLLEVHQELTREGREVQLPFLRKP